jgi:hypothetical protein
VLSGARRRKQGGCPWYVQFGHYIKHSGYLITVSCTEHNHPVSEPTIDGYTEIKYKEDLEIDELEVIRSLSSVNTRIPKMQYSLRTTFPTRMHLYDSQLLQGDLVHLNSCNIAFIFIIIFLMGGMELQRSPLLHIMSQHTD